MLSILALTAQFSEAPLKVVLEDDRLPKVLDSIDQITKAQREAICEFDMEVFNFFAKLSESTGRILCDGCLHSVAVQCGYAEHRLRAARHGPWHLIHGDIRANLDKLQHGPKPKDVVSCKIRALMGLGLDPDSLVPGVHLLAEAPWSTKLAEQWHTLSSRLF